MVLVLTLVQSLARPFHSFLLRTTHLVNYCRQSSTTGGIRRHPAYKRQWQACDACAASSSVGHGLSTNGPVLYLCYIHFLLQGAFALPHSSRLALNGHLLMFPWAFGAEFEVIIIEHVNTSNEIETLDPTYPPQLTSQSSNSLSYKCSIRSHQPPAILTLSLK